MGHEAQTKTALIAGAYNLCALACLVRGIEAGIRIWVLRFSIPPQARGQKVTIYPNLACETPDERGRFGLDGYQFGYQLTVLGNDDTLWSQPVEDSEALLLELRGFKRFHSR